MAQLEQPRFDVIQCAIGCVFSLFDLVRAEHLVDPPLLHKLNEPLILPLSPRVLILHDLVPPRRPQPALRPQLEQTALDVLELAVKRL